MLKFINWHISRNNGIITIYNNVNIMEVKKNVAHLALYGVEEGLCAVSTKTIEVNYYTIIYQLQKTAEITMVREFTGTGLSKKVAANYHLFIIAWLPRRSGWELLPDISLIGPEHQQRASSRHVFPVKFRGGNV